MEKYIPLNAVLAEIKRILSAFENSDASVDRLRASTLIGLLSFLDTLEVEEVDLEKFGEIARHLIAVKEHIEDMRLDKDE